MRVEPLRPMEGGDLQQMSNRTSKAMTEQIDGNRWQLGPEVRNWLLQGDVAIQYQVHRDLLGDERPDLQERIATGGWGAEFLSRRQPNGHWGRSYYQPKWISTHYTLLDLRDLELPPNQPEVRETLARVLEHGFAPDGGINISPSNPHSDLCVNGMFLNFACYFGMPEADLQPIVDLMLREHMRDGGFNCELARGAVHSSLHTTISVLEGILEYSKSGYSYRLSELRGAAAAAREFILRHRLYRSHRTGEVIDKRMLLLCFPTRWYYDILRGLDYLREAGVEYDSRMQDALQVLTKKCRKDGRWPVQGKKPGQVHFDMEPTGQPSRWNTLRALRVLRHFKRT